jgi:hypothetical protein
MKPIRAVRKWGRMAEEKHPYNEAGRRIKAALVSFQLGRAGVDRTLKETPEDAGEGWAELAEQLLYEMVMRIGYSYNPAPKGPIRIK